jgi:hypothetical protein
MVTRIEDVPDDLVVDHAGERSSGQLTTPFSFN